MLKTYLNILQFTQEEQDDKLPNLQRQTSDVILLSQRGVGSNQQTQSSTSTSHSKSRQKAKEEVLDNKVLTNINQILSDHSNPAVSKVLSKEDENISTFVDYIKTTLARCNCTLQLEMQHKLMEVCFWVIRKLNSEQAKQKSPFTANNAGHVDTNNDIFDE